MSKYGTYTCAQCFQTFGKGRPDEETWAENCKELPELKSLQKEEICMVCDDCYKAMMWPDKYPLLVEKAHFERRVNKP